MMKQFIDQTAHFVVAFAVLLLASFAGASLTPVAGAVIGCAFGLIREVTEADPIDSWRDALDITFWTLGGLLAGCML